MSKVYLYKMTTDNGGAPCVYDGELSLAICKPAIRTSAHPGDYIMGFAGNSLYKSNSNCLVYAAKVAHCLSGQKYYANDYKQRPDCIYRFLNGEYRWRSGAKFHGREDLGLDLGEPPNYARAKVLLVEEPSDFRYFRDSCPIDYKSRYKKLAKFIREMKQGHRTNLDENLRGDVLSLLSEVWSTRQTLKDSDVPSTPSPIRCSQDEGETDCDCKGLTPMPLPENGGSNNGVLTSQSQQILIPGN